MERQSIRARDPGQTVPPERNPRDGRRSGRAGRVLNLGFGEFLKETNSATTIAGGSVLLDDWFLGLIVLAGALGAVFSMIYRSFGEFYTLTADPSIPQPVFMVEALLARTLIGSVSALFLFLVARTEFDGIGFAESLLTSPLALLVVGFVAGFSERLVDDAVEKVVEDVEVPEEESSDEETGDSSEENGDGRTDTGAAASDEGGQVTDEGGDGGDDGSEGGRDDDAGPGGRSPDSS